MHLKALIKALNLSFLFKINSWLWKLLLKINNIKVGKNFYIEGSVLLKLKGSKKIPIIIYNNVSIFGDLDLRTRENGQIIIKENVVLDSDIRIVAAQKAVVKIGNSSKLGCRTIINAGADISIDRNCLIGANCSINSSDHKIICNQDFSQSGYFHKPILIGKNSWIGTNVVVLPGVNIGEGVVVGASSIVTKDIPPNTVSAGIPSKVIRKIK